MTNDADELRKTLACAPVTLANAPVRTVHLRVFGLGASRHGAHWQLSLSAKRWRVGEHEGEGRLWLVKPMSTEETRELGRQMPHEQHFEVRARMREPSDDVGLFVELIGPSTAMTTPEPPRPRFFEDEGLGLSVSYDDELEWWHGTLRWCGDDIELALRDGGDGPAETIEVIRRLAATQRAQREWTRSAKDCAADRLLDLHTDTWREKGRKPLTLRGFKTKLKLRTIVVSPSGELSFAFFDGGLFQGHSVRVQAHVDTGMTGAEI